MDRGKPGSVCNTAASCTLLFAPIRMTSLSPLSVAPNHTVEFSARMTFPTTVAFGAMYALDATIGESSPNLYKAICAPAHWIDHHCQIARYHPAGCRPRATPGASSYH